MAETVGTKTKQKTSVGKDVYKTPEGESVSEKSVTIKFGDEAYVNAPSIHEGKQYTEDEIKEMLLEGVIKPTSRHDTLEEAVKAAETRSDNLLKDGGMALAKQMEMFDDGGLMDEGGTVDPVSGNDVPPGSTQEEVRDDIPAQLSEGEFVFPADVVRYFGLEKLMEMRQEAKMGLQRMDDMGQMGNSEEAIMPDNLPFDIDDIDMEDDNELEMSQGGVVHMANGGPVGQIGTFNPSNPLPGALGAPVGQIGPNIQAGTQVVVYGPDGTAYGNAAIAQAAGVTNYTMTPPAGQTSQPTPPTGQATAPVQAASAQFQPLAGTKFMPTTIQKVMPTFKETMGMGVPYVDYDPSPQDETEEETESPSVDTTTTTQQPQDNGGGDGLGTAGTGTATVGSISDALKSLGNLFGKDDTPKGKSVGDIFKSAAETNNFYGGSKAFGFSNEELRAATAGQGFAQLGSIGLGGMVSDITKELGVTDFNLKDVGVAGFTGMNNALNSIGLVNRGQLMNNAQATLVGNTMAAAHAAAYKGQDPAAAIKEVLNSKEAIAIQDAAYNSIKNGWQEKSGYKGNLTDGAFAKEMRSTVEKANAVLVDLESGSTTAPSGKTVGTKVMSRDMKTGLFTKPTNVYTKEGRALKNAQTAKAQQAQVLADRADAKAARDARNAQARASVQARADAAAKEAATAGPGNSTPGDYDSYGATDDEAGDVGQGDGGRSSGEDTTSAASDNYDSDGWGDFNKGGLVSQMKRSGLASKK